MPKTKLTHQSIKGLSTPEKPTEYYDTKETGLILRLSKAGTKTFAYRYQIGDKKRRMTLGKFPAISLAEARQRVQKIKVQVNDGIDPQVEKKRKKRKRAEKKITLLYAVNEYKKRHLPKLKQSTQDDYENRIKHIVKGQGEGITKSRGLPSDLELKDIKRAEILELLEGIAKTAPTQAQRVQAIISGVYSFSIDRGWIDFNVARNINFKPRKRKKKKKWQNIAFDDEQIRLLWKNFCEYNQPVGAWFKLLMILGQRAGETRKMEWKHINWKKNEWYIPGPNAKNDRNHFVPLNERALNVLEEMRKHTGKKEFVFLSPVKKDRPIGHQQKAAERISERSGVKDFNIHSLRTTVLTRMAALGISQHVVSKYYNHTTTRYGE
ncbi:MAG: tyrosine-type recombinase/integrase [Balneolaceae bacterium]|nr:tyrosine-type recombinase/integrase [Balneolaceae bacterium]